MVVDHEMDALNESLQVQEDVSDQIYLPTINRAEKLHTPTEIFIQFKCIALKLTLL